MMKKVLLAGVLGFFLGLYLFFPYRELYGFAFARFAPFLKWHGMQAGAFHIELEQTELDIRGLRVSFDKISAGINPVGYFWGNILEVMLQKEGAKGNLRIFKKDGVFWISGAFEPLLFKDLPVPFPVKDVLKVSGKLFLARGMLRVSNLVVKDGFVLKASGYISGKGSEFSGYFEFKGIKRRFKWRG